MKAIEETVSPSVSAHLLLLIHLAPHGAFTDLVFPVSRRHGFVPAEVPLSGRAGVPDHVPGAHHEVLPHLAGRGAAVPGLLRRGGGGSHEDRRVRAARVQRAQ